MILKSLKSVNTNKTNKDFNKNLYFLKSEKKSKNTIFKKFACNVCHAKEGSACTQTTEKSGA